MENSALFLHFPRRVSDLRRPHLIDWEQPYTIVHRVFLTAIDYENFISDMTVQRDYLREAEALCTAGPVVRCILVRRKGRRDGILVVPERDGGVAWAAYWAEQ